MAVQAWINFNDGDTLADIRAKLNAFNTSVNTEVDANEQDILNNAAAIAAPKDSIKFTPQVTPPAHVEGQAYYDEVTGSFKAQGPIPGVEVAIGHDMHIHVVNNSGVIIEKGMAVRQNGVAGGKIQVVKAIATSFDEARVFGVAQADIPIGADGAIATFGEIRDTDTNGQPTGVPLYLSDTVAGTYGPIAPDIVTRIGGCLQADALTGRFFVSIINNTTLPTVLGGLQGQTVGNETYTVTATPQDITNYLTEENIVSEVDPLTGVVYTPNDGEYRMNFTASMTFPSSTSTREVTFEFYDITGATVLFEYTMNIPRDATADSSSFTVPFYSSANDQYKMRVKGTPPVDITFTAISFDIESVNIR